MTVHYFGRGSTYIGDGDSLAYVLGYDDETDEIIHKGYGYEEPSTAAKIKAEITYTDDRNVIERVATRYALAAGDAAYRGAKMTATSLKNIERGDRVRLMRPTMRGKNAHIREGAEGVVIWIGEDSYSRTGGLKFGVRFDGIEGAAFLEAYRFDPAIDLERAEELALEIGAAAFIRIREGYLEQFAHYGHFAPLR